MDFEESALETGFTFTNPNEKGRCGCGAVSNVTDASVRMRDVTYPQQADSGNAALKDGWPTPSIGIASSSSSPFDDLVRTRRRRRAGWSPSADTESPERRVPAPRTAGRRSWKMRARIARGHGHDADARRVDLGRLLRRRPPTSCRSTRDNEPRRQRWYTKSAATDFSVV